MPQTGGMDPVERSVIEVLDTCRAIRRFESREVSDHEVLELLDAGIRAPSGGNAQTWRFVVIRDQAMKRALGEEVAKGTAWKMVVNRVEVERGLQRGDLSAEESAAAERMNQAFGELARSYESIPVLIVVCVEPDSAMLKAAWSWPSFRSAFREFGPLGVWSFVMSGSKRAEWGMWASGYPAVENILLAARAKGLGAALTAPQLLSPPGRIERVLDIPKGVRVCAVIPVGYPKDRFGPVRRKPLGGLVYRDSWGTQFPEA